MNPFSTTWPNLWPGWWVPDGDDFNAIAYVFTFSILKLLVEKNKSIINDDDKQSVMTLKRISLIYFNKGQLSEVTLKIGSDQKLNVTCLLFTLHQI